MGIEVSEISGWVKIAIDGRVDAFNFEELVEKISNASMQGSKCIVLDLVRAKFLSLKSIKYFSQLAESLKDQGGLLVLLGSSEKLKYQIHTFASLEAMELYRSEDEWRRSIPQDSPAPQL